MNRQEIIDCLKEQDPLAFDQLYQRADATRKQFVGDDVFLRGIIEFSNICSRHCLYCGLRQSNDKVTRYQMSAKEIVSSAENAVRLGISTVVLQSGESAVYTVDELCGIIAEIKKQDLVITLSIGERSHDDFKKLKDAGADRYLLRFETSDQDLFKKLRPGCDFKKRWQCLLSLKKLGYQVGSGIMVGLPGQSLESIADDILLFNDLDLDMIGIGPFLPHPHTPLADHTHTGLTMVLKVLALTRIVTKNAHIPATTAVGTIDQQGRQKALRCGANIIMPNITPMQYRKFYEIYPDKICINEEAAQCRGCVEAMIKASGRTLGQGPGHSLKINFKTN